MDDDFTQCMVSNSRMAARAITRRYDALLRPHGITSSQISLLAAIRSSGGRTVSAMADAFGFERTTLTRNLDRLEQMGLVSSHPADRRNGRICSVTPQGAALIEELLPIWRRAQAEMRELLTDTGFSDTLRVLQRLAKA
jgi:DNA-binding MarR family transcriptional regulator